MVKTLTKKPKSQVTINLNCYSIRFRVKETKKPLNLKEAFNNESYKDIIKKLILTLNTFVNKNEDRILVLDKTLSLTESVYSCIVMKGHNGHETYVGEVTNKKVKQLHIIKRDQFSYIPFYCMLAIEDQNSDKIIFLAQSYKQFGFKEVFEESFKEFYKTNYSADINCEIGTFCISKLFEKYVSDGDIRKMRFKKHKLTPFMENMLKSTENEKVADDYEMEISVKAKKIGFLNMKQNINFKNSTFMETFKIDGFDYDEAFADISVAGRKRVLNVTSPEKFSAAFDVTDKAKINEVTNHPDFDALNDEAKLILKEEIIPNLN